MFSSSTAVQKLWRVSLQVGVMVGSWHPNMTFLLVEVCVGRENDVKTKAAVNTQVNDLRDVKKKNHFLSFKPAPCLNTDNQTWQTYCSTGEPPLFSQCVSDSKLSFCRSFPGATLGMCSFGQELSETRKRSFWSGTMNPSFCSLSLLSDITKVCLGSMTTALSLFRPAHPTSLYEGRPDPRLNFMIGQWVGRRCAWRT